MELIRGWERQYTPDNTGGLRLSKARLYREIGEEEGLGDKREGETRVNMTGEVKSTADSPLSVPMDLTIAFEDEPEIEVKNLVPGERREIKQSLRVGDTQLDSPFLFCLSRNPVTRSAWEKLQCTLPKRYDTWTITDNVDALRFEIECGLKRWLALNGITIHRMNRCQGWVDYSYDMFPPGAELSDLTGALQLLRWFRKSRRYKGQQEYRLAWEIYSPQMERLPDAIDIELTRTGLGLFKPWSPPTR